MLEAGSLINPAGHPVYPGGFTMTAPSLDTQFVPTVSLAELQEAGALTVTAGGHTIAHFLYDGEVYAIDNRCPHMGFPLDKGTVKDGLLACHWHHARFDLRTGGTFDQFADDVRSFPAEVRDGMVYVDVAPQADRHAYYLDRLQVGLERNISLVIGKAVIYLLDNDGDPNLPFRIGLEFGARNNRFGWGAGLTVLSGMMNLLPQLAEDDRPRALYHGLAMVAGEVAGSPPRFPIRPLPGAPSDVPTLKAWFRQFIEVRDDEGAERCIISALAAGATNEEMADMLFAAVTDHRYIDVGHPADFTNKALEALDRAGWDLAPVVLPSLVRGYATAARMEERNAWRYPIDIIEILSATFANLPATIALEPSGQPISHWRDQLAPIMLEDDPQATVDAMVNALSEGCSMVELASVVTYAAGRRIAHFHISNEFGDWDTALHTFTFANAIESGLRRAPSRELLRGVFDAAMSVYLDRFLNIPSTRLPEPNGNGTAPADMLTSFNGLLNQQQQVNEAGALTANYLAAGGDSDALIAKLAEMLLREDRDFHTLQSVEAGIAQFNLHPDDPAAVHMLIASARYLAAHAPTVRAQGQTYRIAQRLHRGEKLFEG